jgi:hypothetical protein
MGSNLVTAEMKLKISCLSLTTTSLRSFASLYIVTQLLSQVLTLLALGPVEVRRLYTRRISILSALSVSTTLVFRAYSISLTVSHLLRCTWYVEVTFNSILSLIALIAFTLML